MQFRGDVTVEICLENFRNQILPSFEVELEEELKQYRSYDKEITAADILASENLSSSLESAIPNLFAQLCWSEWQGSGDFPEADLKSRLGSDIARMNLQ